MKDRSTEFDPARLEAELTREELAAERWLPVLGWEGIYDVSDMGRVRSYWSGNHRKVIERHRVLSFRIASHGYIKVKLCRPGRKNVERWVHRLVLDAFVGPSEDDQGHHDDTIRTNNRLANLKWTTPGENARHRTLGQRLRAEGN